MIEHVRAASAHWQCGEKALANLRLAFAHLPKLREPADAYRMCLAEHLLDAGVAPASLMQGLSDGLGDDLGKYNRDEPRVPAGSGRESGWWTSEPGGGFAPDASRPGTIVVAEEGPPESEREYEERRHLGETTAEEDAKHGRGIAPSSGLLTGAGQISNTAGQLSAALREPPQLLGRAKGRSMEPRCIRNSRNRSML